jgi:hypothetical protein
MDFPPSSLNLKKNLRNLRRKKRRGKKGDKTINVRKIL